MDGYADLYLFEQHMHKIGNLMDSHVATLCFKLEGKEYFLCERIDCKPDEEQIKNIFNSLEEKACSVIDTKDKQ